MNSDPKFLILTVHVGRNESEMNKVSDVVVRRDFIKQVSLIEQSDPDSKVLSLTPVVGKCGITLIDGNSLICAHTFEEVCAFLEASRVATIH